MIVEIHGIDERRMKELEKLLPSLGLSELTKKERLDWKICLSADNGDAQRVRTYRTVWGANGIRVFLREPGELAVTMDGSLQWVCFVAGALGAADILKNGGEFVLAKLLEKEYKNQA